MSGGARNEKRRRQDAANARLAAAGITPPKAGLATRIGGGATRLIVVVIALVVVFAVVLAYYLIARPSGGNSVTPTYRATASGAVVTAGSGPVVVDSYEDFLCSACERFESRYGDEVVTALNANQITVRFHTIAILDDRSSPAGYSTRAADAALCAAQAGAYPKVRQQLFAKQPAEGGPGLSDDQLAALGTSEGASGDFASCVAGTTHDAAIRKETAAAVGNTALQDNGSFGTPTVTVNGKRIDVNDSSWLADAIAGK